MRSFTNSLLIFVLLALGISALPSGNEARQARPRFRPGQPGRPIPPLAIPPWAHIPPWAYPPWAQRPGQTSTTLSQTSTTSSRALTTLSKSTTTVTQPSTTVSQSSTTTTSQSSTSTTSPSLTSTASRPSTTSTRLSTTSSTTQSSTTTSTSQSSTTTSQSTTTTTSQSTTTTTSAAAPTYTVDRVGFFNNFVAYTFPGNSLPAGLTASDNQLIGDTSSDKDVGVSAPYNHIFLASNVAVSDGYLQIKVPGGQNPSTRQDNAVTSGEVSTNVQNILYASVRTNIIFSSVPGTCQAAFFYKSDTQEADIEFLSDPTSGANNGQPQIHYTNQPTNGGSSTSVAGSMPASYDTVQHEYRIDWTAGYTAYYIDGKLQQNLTTNVPSQAGSWVWNNWANGDPQWSVGPPAQDNIMKIGSIVMFYNTTST